MADIFAQEHRQNPYFEALLKQGMDTSPIQAKSQGLSRLAFALLSGLEMRDQDQKDKEAQALRMNLPGLNDSASASPAAAPAPASMSVDAAPSPPQAAPTQAGGPDYGKAISSIESGGNYGALGPVTKTGDRAYGRYQVMGANVGPWSKEALGQPMTPQQFAGNPQAQDAVFKAKFGQYVDKYGPEGAARAWFAGEGGMNNPNARDQLGTTVAGYGQKFNAAMGNGQPAQAPSGPPAATPVAGAPGVTGVPWTGGGAAPPPQQQPVHVAQAGQGAPVPQRAPVQIDPRMATQIRAMIGSRDPAIQQQGYQLYQQFAKPREETRPLTDPRERAKYGIQPTDSNPYQVDSKGEVKAINPQPFAVNVNQQNASEFEKEYGQGMAKEALGVVQSGDKAVGDIQNVQLVRGLLNDIKTGKLTPGQATIGGWMQSVGIDPKVVGIDPNLPATAEAARALMSKMALSNIGGAGGIPANNFSEADRKFVVGMTSSLSNRPEANEILLDAKERVSQLAMQKADAWAQARDAGTSYEKFNSAWRKQLASQNVFADLIAKADALKAAGSPGEAPAAAPQGGVRRYNPATGKIE